jgi:hypothetical protein
VDALFFAGGPAYPAGGLSPSDRRCLELLLACGRRRRLAFSGRRRRKRVYDQPIRWLPAAQMVFQMRGAGNGQSEQCRRAPATHDGSPSPANTWLSGPIGLQRQRHISPRDRRPAGSSHPAGPGSTQRAGARSYHSTLVKTARLAVCRWGPALGGTSRERPAAISAQRPPRRCYSGDGPDHWVTHLRHDRALDRPMACVVSGATTPTRPDRTV